MKVSYNQIQLYHRNVLEIIEESLNDLPSKERNDGKLINVIEQRQSTAYTGQNVRYKLIIDNSEDDSAVRYLFTCGMLKKLETHMFACSDFPEESGQHVSHIVTLISMYCLYR